MSDMTRYLFLLLFSVCSVSNAACAEIITIAGSTTVKKYIELAAETFAAAHPEMIFDIEGGESTHGFGSVVNGRAHIGMISRELTGKELAGMGDIRQVAIAVDAVVSVISAELYRDGGITGLSPDTLAKIYRGEITNWRQAGGPDRAILVVSSRLNSGTRRVFGAYILASPTAAVTPDAIMLERHDDTANLIKASDQAIAYFSISYTGDRIDPLPLIVQGKHVRASKANIRNGSYPLSRKLYLLLADDAPSHVQTFVDFILSPAGQKIAEKAGYLPVE